MWKGPLPVAMTMAQKQLNTAGDAYAIEPGHDAWVVGDKQAVAYEFHGVWGDKL